MHQNRQSAPREISSSIKKCTYLNKLTAKKKAQSYKELRFMPWILLTVNLAGTYSYMPL
jgi:hypothetical protein